MRRFEEIPHTADWSFRAYGHSLPQLFENAAYAMFELEGIHAEWGTPETVRVVHVSGIDYESLLVNFLSELLYLQESNQEGYYYFRVEILPKLNLRAQVRGQALTDKVKLIKAVTHHDLKIKETREGFQVTIVVDV